jgi:ribosome biogenesis GTPase
VDAVVIVCSPSEPPFRPGLIDRYLVAISRDGLDPVLCLNKVDLGVSEDVDVFLDGYAAIGIAVIRTSAATGDGVDSLRDVLRGKIALLTGHSGVGKSSLLNALEPGLALRIGEVTQTTAGQGKGRHTTTSARLIPLSMEGTYLVDSPGIRAFSVRGIAPRELAGHFPDLSALAEGCAFRDCLHTSESGCNVVRGAADSAFFRRRLESYRSILTEL